jgi:TP901 family phage tail tape measure protein
VAFKTIEVQLIARAEGYSAGLARAASETDAFAGRIEQAALRGDRGARTLGTSLLGVSAVMLGLEALGARAFVGFDQRMRNVQSITQDGEAQFHRYEQAALDISTTVPQSANAVAEGLYNIASSGFKGAAGIEVARASAKAAAAGLSDMVTAGTAITGVLNAYGLSAASATHVSDVLFQTVNLGVVNFSELSNQLGHFVGLAAQMNIPLEQVGAAFSTITLAGVPAADAGVTLNRVMLSLVKPTSDLQALYKQWGVSSGQALVEQLGLAGAVNKVNEAAGGSAAKIVDLTGDVRALRGFLALGAQDGTLYANQLKQFGDVSGATQKALEQQSKSLGFQLGIMRNEVTNAGMALVSSLMGPLRSVIGFVADAAHGFSSLPGPIRDIAGAAVLLTGVLAGLAGGALLLARPVQSLAELFGLMPTTARATAESTATIVPTMEALTLAINQQTTAYSRLAVAKGEAAITGPAAGASTASGLLLPASAAAGGAAAASGAGEAAAGAAGIGAIGAEAGATTAAAGGLAASLGLVATGVGAVIGVAGLAVVALSMFGHQSRQAADAQRDLKQAADLAVQGETDAATAAVLHSESVANLLPKVHQYHLNLVDLVGAIQGNGDAQARLSGQIDRAAPSLELNAHGHAVLNAAIRGHKAAADELLGTTTANLARSGEIQTAQGQQTLSAAKLVGTISGLVRAHKIDADTARELAGALGASAGGHAQNAAAAEADAVASARDAAAKAEDAKQRSLWSDTFSGFSSGTAAVQRLQAAESSGTSVTNAGNTAKHAQAQANINAASSALALERANRSVAKAQIDEADAVRDLNNLLAYELDEKQQRLQLDMYGAFRAETQALDAESDAQERLNDLLAFGLAEERERAAIARDSSVLDQADAVKQLADAEHKLRDIQSGRVGMADSERPRAIADAQEAVARARLRVRSASLDQADAERKLSNLQGTGAAGQARELANAQLALADAQDKVETSALAATDAERALNQFINSGRAREIADAQDKVANASLSMKEAQEQVALTVQRAAEQQDKAADTIAGAADKMGNAVGAGQKKAHASFDQWKAEMIRSAKDQSEWWNNIQALAASGHAALAGELFKMGPEFADYARAAVDAATHNPGSLADLDSAMQADIKMAHLHSGENMQALLDNLAGISATSSPQIAIKMAEGIAAGDPNVVAALNTYLDMVGRGVNAVIEQVGGKLVVYDPNILREFTGRPNERGETGGLKVRFSAHGGIEDHSPQIASGQWPARVWAEPETHWEAYIPGAPDRRDRAVGITREVAQRFGYALVPLAFGGFLSQLGQQAEQLSGLAQPPDFLGGSATTARGYRDLASAMGIYAHDQALVDIIRNAITGPPAAGGAPGAAGPVPPGAVQDWLLAAIGLTGVGQDWLSGLYRLVMAESGGDPHSYNSTPVGSEHAEGLLQTLPSTFAAHALPGHGDIWNPIDNAAAAIRYIIGRYGTVYNTPLFRGGPYAGYVRGGIFAPTSSDGIPVGVYDQGGFLPTGVSVAVNNTGRPEVVGGGGGLNLNAPLMVLDVKVGAGTDVGEFKRATEEVVRPMLRGALRTLSQQRRVAAKS